MVDAVNAVTFANTPSDLRADHWEVRIDPHDGVITLNPEFLRRAGFVIIHQQGFSVLCRDDNIPPEYYESELYIACSAGQSGHSRFTVVYTAVDMTQHVRNGQCDTRFAARNIRDALYDITHDWPAFK